MSAAATFINFFVITIFAAVTMIVELSEVRLLSAFLFFVMFVFSGVCAILAGLRLGNPTP